MINYLDYINSPTPENIKLVHQASGLTQKQAANMIGVQIDTIKGWHSPAGTTRHRTPQVAVWNLYLFELHARSAGSGSLLDLLKTSVALADRICPPDHQKKLGARAFQKEPLRIDFCCHNTDKSI